ncbi:MAG: cytochrome c3 family protein [bacterium]
MRIKDIVSLLFVLFLRATALAITQEESQTQKENSCISCHLEIGEELARPVEGMKQDVHAQRGLSCADCHGGDPESGLDGDLEAAMDPAKGYLGVPKRTEIPKFCARCHSDPNYMRRFNPRVSTDQFDRYKTSVHGKLLQKGDTKVATCTDCHGVHGIRNARDARSSVYPLNIPNTCGRCHADSEYMKDYGIPTDQIEAYKISVHGKALLEKGDQAAPACNDCHGNHGATPPGAPSIAYICGQCHLNNSELFFNSPHRAAFDELELPECETCHGNHGIQHPTDEMLGIGVNSICMDCHEEDSKGYITAIAMRQQIENLKNKIYLADSLVSKAERAGMQVSQAKFQLTDADDALIKARTMIHSLSVSRITEVTGQGIKLAAEASIAGRAALAEIQFRRKGLAISIVFILLLATGLYLKIKEMDRKYSMRMREKF